MIVHVVLSQPAKKKNKKKSSNKASVNSAENIVNSNVQTKKAAAETSFPSGVESKESFIQNGLCMTVKSLRAFFGLIYDL